MDKRLDNITHVVKYLLDDAGLKAKVPDSLEDCQRLMRALLNVREPRPVSKDFLKWQDEELQAQKNDKGIVEIPHFKDKEQFRIAGSFTFLPFYPFTFLLWHGDITRLKTDAIVNAANSQMLGCFRPFHNCIDNCIHSAAGVQLRLECNDIMQRIGREARTSEAFITKGYNLPSRYVIHTVGPIIPDGVPTPGQEVQLANCYTNCLDLADTKNLRSIAFCCISTGVFMFPQRRAAEIATSAVRAWLANHQSSSVKTIVFNVFKDSDYDIYKSLCKQG